VAGLAFDGPGYSQIIANFNGSWTSDQQQVVNTAVAQWNALLTIPQELDVFFSIGSISFAYPVLGITGIIPDGTSSGFPTHADIRITNDPQYKMSWNLTNYVSGQNDVFSVVEHELGHALGFSYGDALLWDKAITYSSGNAYIQGYQLGALHPDQVLSHLADVSDLMSGFIMGGARVVPSQADLNILSLTYGYTINPAQVIGSGASLTINSGATQWNFVGLLNNGTVENNGTYISNYALTNNGMLNNNSGATLINNITLTNNGTINNNGTMDNYGMLYNNAGTTLTNNSTMNMGFGTTLTNSNGAILTNNGTLTMWYGTTLANNGILNNYGTIDYYGGSGITLTNSGTLTNYGTLIATTFNVENNNLLINTNFVDGAGNVHTGYLRNNSIWNNNAGATLINNGEFLNAGMLNNYGNVTNSGTFTNWNTLTNYNTLINDIGGTLAWDGLMNNNANAVLTNNGTLTIWNGIVNNYGTLTNSGTLTMDNGGYLGNYSGTLTNNGTITIIYGNMANDATLTNNGTLINNSWLGNNGTLNNNGNIVITAGSTDMYAGPYAGRLLNTGTLNNNAGSTLTNSGTLQNMGTLTNNGTLINNLGGTVTNIGFDQYGNIFTATLTNMSGGTITNNGTLTNSGTLTNAGIINGAGAYTQTAGQTVNNGILTQTSVNINGGMLSGAGTINGNVNIAAGAFVHPGNSPGTMAINGNFTSSGNLIFDIEGLGTDKYSVLQINGNAYFYGGAVEFYFNSFNPSAGDSWEFLFANSITGWDANTLSFIFNGLGPGLMAEFIPINSNDFNGEELLIVKANTVPIPPTMLLFGFGLIGLAGMRRKIKQ